MIAYHTALPRTLSQTPSEDRTVKFEIQQAILQKSLDLVAGVVPSKTTLPILKSILVEATAKGLSFSATNLDISMVTQTDEVEVAEEGKNAVPAGKLVSFVRSLAPGAVQISVTGGKLFIRSGKASLEESCMNPEEFPSLPELIEGEGLEVPGDVIGAMIAETSYSVSRDETRPALLGILWAGDAEGLTMVATDAHRLARSCGKFGGNCSEARSMIVGTGGLRHLPRIAA